MATKKEEVKSVKAEVKTTVQQPKVEQKVDVAYTAAQEPVSQDAPQPQQPPVYQEQPHYVHNTYSGHNNQPKPYANIVTKFVRPSRLSPAGKEYSSTFAEELKKCSFGHGLEVIDIASPNLDATVVYKRSSKLIAVLLYFESMSPSSVTVPSDYIDEVIKAFKAAIKQEDVEYRSISSVTVVPEEYNSGYATIMAQTIVNTFTGYSISVSSEFNVSSLEDSAIYITTNMARVRNYIKKCSPHAISDRDDIGFLVSFCDKSRPMVEQNDENTLFAVTGYTKFVTSELPAYNGRGNRMCPVVTITNIASVAPITGYVPFAVSLAGRCFCDANMWHEPYKNFADDKPNLGYLIDAIGNVPVKSMQEFNALCANYFTEPVLAIDISNGRYNLPGVTSLCYGNVPMYMHLNRFFRNDEAFKDTPDEMAMKANSVLYSELNYKSLTGITIDQTGPMDSRWIDYLTLYSSFADDPSAIQELRGEPTDPLARINSVKAHYPNTRAIYRTNTIAFTKAFIQWVTDNLCKARIVCLSDMASTSQNHVAPSALINSRANWSTMNPFVTTPVGGGNPSGYSPVI